MLRWQTAGESHGEALVAMIEGLPAGVRISTDDIVSALARRRLGYGRGARMKFEQDKVRLLTGVRHGLTLGSPVAIEIANTEWPKWTEVMSADALDHDLPREGRNAPLSRPRPGHADLTGMRKYGFDDARPVLERSSARETASRVALGEVAKQFLDQAFGIRTVACRPTPTCLCPPPTIWKRLMPRLSVRWTKRPKPASSNASTRPRRPPIRWAA